MFAHQPLHAGARLWPVLAAAAENAVILHAQLALRRPIREQFLQPGHRIVFLADLDQTAHRSHAQAVGGGQAIGVGEFLGGGRLGIVFLQLAQPLRRILDAAGAQLEQADAREYIRIAGTRAQ